MSEQLILLIGTLLGGGVIGTAFTALLSSRSTNAKNFSDSAVALSNAYAVMIDRHEKDIGRLDMRLQNAETERAALLLELASARDENRELRKQIDMLRVEIVELRANKEDRR